MVNFGRLLRDYRRSRGLTQENIASLARLSVRTVRGLEGGTSRRPYSATVQDLVMALKLDHKERATFELAARGELVTPTRDGITDPMRAIPTQPTELIGRDEEVASLTSLMQRPSKRLVTLTGPGGVGKTRLAIRVAEHALAHFTDGVIFIDLSAIQCASLVGSSIATRFGLDLRGQRSPQQVLADYLCEKHLLLVLDNYEQVIASAPLLGDLLTFCPDLKMVVTSRELLRLQGEHEFPVCPLKLPPSGDDIEHAATARYAAIQLFVERAQAVRPDFTLTADNMRAVAAICGRVDGLPLAIELAAKRVKLLPPQALLARLDERLPLLSGGAVDSPSRLQTMRNAIGWSYDLLDDFQKSLFRRLSVFVGGCTVEAAEAICAMPDVRSIDVLEGLAALVDKSLVRQVEHIDGTGRLMLLETIREYGRTLLAVGDEQTVVADRHADYYAELAEEASRRLDGAEQRTWLDRLEREHDNLRAALRWFEGHGSLGRAVRLAGASYKFWMHRGHVAEGRDNLERLLALTVDMDEDAWRLRALNGAGALAGVAGAHTQTRKHLEDALIGYQALGDTAGVATVLNNLGALTTDQGPYGQAREFFERSIALARAANYSTLLAATLGNLGEVSCRQGLYERARKELEEGIALSQSLDDAHGVCIQLNNLGRVSVELGEYERAADELERAMAMGRMYRYKGLTIQPLADLGHLASIANDDATAIDLCEQAVAAGRLFGGAKLLGEALLVLAAALHKQGSIARARHVYHDALNVTESIGSSVGIPDCIDGLGIVAVGSDAVRAVRLWGAAASLRASLEAPRAASGEADYNACLAMARREMGDSCFNTAWDEGVAMTIEQVVEYAREHRERDDSSSLVAAIGTI